MEGAPDLEHLPERVAYKYRFIAAFRMRALTMRLMMRRRGLAGTLLACSWEAVTESLEYRHFVHVGDKCIVW